MIAHGTPVGKSPDVIFGESQSQVVFLPVRPGPRMIRFGKESKPGFRPII